MTARSRYLSSLKYHEARKSSTVEESGYLVKISLIFIGLFNSPLPNRV